MQKPIKTFALMVSSMLLVSCAATSTLISKRNLEVKTKTSASVFLDPVPDNQKTVYVQMHNTSDQPDFKIERQVIAELKKKGYRVTHHLNRAYYLLQANILQVGKGSQSANEKYLAGGYGSAISGAAMGATAAAMADSSSSGLLAGGLIGGMVSSVAGSLVKDVVYTAITDVQISERSRHAFQQNTKTNLSQGTSTEVSQSGQEQTHWKRYRTRVISSAEKVNLSFKGALPQLESGLSHAIAGFF